MRLLLLNPNTSIHITERLERSARRVLPANARLTAVTASEGPQAVRSAEEVALAVRNVLEMADRHGREHDAVLLGISLDCGLDEARRICAPRPVIGMTEAACLMACLHGPRFGLLTVGSKMAPLYQSHVNQLGLGDRLAGIGAPDAPRAFDASPDNVSEELLAVLAHEAKPLIAAGAEAIVLAGAVLCGYDAALSRRLSLPVLDGMVCAVLLARARLALDHDGMPNLER